jgi:RNA polymerase sigma-70 factor (ECF subfamily)
VKQAQTQSVAFEALFLEYYARIYGVLFRLVGNREEAEDLALETFWRLWREPPRHNENLGGWLYRVAVRLGYNALRAMKRRTTHEEHALDRTAGGPDPAQEAERAEDRARVRAVLERMGEREAQLLILRASGLSYQEISAAVGCAPGSVGTLLARAERTFERLFDG